VAVAHPVLAGDAVNSLKNSAIKEIVVTNSIPIPKEKRFSKIKVLSIAKIFASAINAMHGSKSVSALLNPAK
ncbi:MAG: ribose-phosphate pyrophosphokinase, partial [Candidatus Diapherotrites archaeon]